MTHRERVLLALNHEEGDRVPIDFGAMRSTGIHVLAYLQLKKYLGMEGGMVKVYDLMQMLAEPEKEILEFFDADVVQLHRYAPTFGIPIDEFQKRNLPTGEEIWFPAAFQPVTRENGSREIVVDSKAVAVLPQGGFWFDWASFPLAGAERKEDIDRYQFYVIDEKEVDFLQTELQELKTKYPDYAILGAFGGNIFEDGLFTFGLEKYLTLLIEKPELVEYFNQKNAQNHIHNLRKYLQVVGDEIDIIQMGDDLGTQNAPYLSPSLYRRLIKPYQKMVYDEVHRLNPGVKVFLHSCGSIYPFIPDLIEIGVDILNPVQTTAKGMDPRKLKEEFGRDLVFWGGGVETQGVLLYGTEEEVRRQVRERINILGPGGGFVFNQVHNILPDVPPSNVVAAYQEAQKYGIYPLRGGR